MLAEYGENGTLKTYYTRGAELISQERNGAKSYYLYDGLDSVRMLTDEEGTATDFYTYDAFGNLTEKLGNTENSYLYRGEQFDSFTGLYYLRARYMNPSTGTFITMDEYTGSVFEPVSLHKYLYANANPVMYSDPSGYSSLIELMTACAVSSILGGIINESVCLLRFFFDKSFNLNAYGGDLTLALLNSFVQGAYAGFIFGGFGYIAAHSILVSTAMIAFCGYSAWQNYSSALAKDAKGNSGGAWIDSTLGAMSVIGAFSFAYSAFNQFRAWAASRNPCVKGNIYRYKYTPDENGYFGERGQSSSSSIRQMHGGDAAARDFFNDRTFGYVSETQIPEGVVRMLPDETYVTYRQVSHSPDASPAVSFSGGNSVKSQKIHFID